MVAVAFLGVYVAMFVLRYLLLDRLFRGLGGDDGEQTAFTQATGRGLEDDAGAGTSAATAPTSSS